jgi:hypothetical protein
MDGVWLARLRWRRRGAWLWPTFVVATVLDAVVVHALPMLGDRQSFFGGLLAGLILNLLVVLFCSRPVGSLLRRRRGELPVGVARNYAGTLAVSLVSAGLLCLGLLHHRSIMQAQRALDDAIVRAEAFIGDHAPATFAADALHTDTFTIQSGIVYRTCVPSRDGARTYCVIVKPKLPLARSVIFAGYEPNSIFAQGAN